ncbi:hypothetical protein HK096_007263, partial [Nowakowskiella sp. JEL0078]
MGNGASKNASENFIKEISFEKYEKQNNKSRNQIKIDTITSTLPISKKKIKTVKHSVQEFVQESVNETIKESVKEQPFTVEIPNINKTTSTKILSIQTNKSKSNELKKKVLPASAVQEIKVKKVNVEPAQTNGINNIQHQINVTNTVKESLRQKFKTETIIREGKELTIYFDELQSEWFYINWEEQNIGKFLLKQLKHGTCFKLAEKNVNTLEDYSLPFLPHKVEKYTDNIGVSHITAIFPKSQLIRCTFNSRTFVWTKTTFEQELEIPSILVAIEQIKTILSPIDISPTSILQVLRDCNYEVQSAITQLFYQLKLLQPDLQIID